MGTEYNQVVFSVPAWDSCDPDSWPLPEPAFVLRRELALPTHLPDAQAPQPSVLQAYASHCSGHSCSFRLFLFLPDLDI